MEFVIDDLSFSKVSDVFRCRKNGCDRASRVNSRSIRSFFDQSVVVGCVYCIPWKLYDPEVRIVWLERPKEFVKVFVQALFAVSVSDNFGRLI
jgi:hypothetical protein